MSHAAGAVHDAGALTDGTSHTRRPALPGDPGVWVFIAADVFAFGLFFALFTWGRLHHTALYEESRRSLDANIGLLNTVILLTSGWFMVRAVEGARAGSRPRTVRNLGLAMVIGAAFAVTKVLEYTSKIQAGITMLSNEFFMYYFVFTGIHFLHFVIGLVVLAVCLSKARTQALDAGFKVWIESAASYWHMVDLLWIVLFPLLYLQR